MNGKQKEILMNTVLFNDCLVELKTAFTQNKLIKDESYFDYELLKATLENKSQCFIPNFLLNEGCRARNPNKSNSEDSPFHLAMKSNSYRTIEKIIKNGGSIYDKNKNGETPIHAGFNQRSYESVVTALILSCSGILDSTNKDDLRHFHIACILEVECVIKKYLHMKFDSSLLLKEYNNSNHIDFERRIPCCLNGLYTLRFENILVTDSPKELGYDKISINKIIHLSRLINPGFTPLHFIVMYTREVMYNREIDFEFLFRNGAAMQRIIKNGADSNTADERGITPLHLACEEIKDYRSLSSKIIEMLLDSKANPAAVDNKGSTPLHVTFYKTKDLKSDMIDLLISKIPRKVNFTDDEGLSYFHIFCTRGDLNRVNDFLKSGEAINSCPNSGKYSGYTALHFAVLCNKKEVVEILLKNNAQVNAKTSKFQLTPLHVACNHVKYRIMNTTNDKVLDIDEILHCDGLEIDIIKLLLLYGADVDARDYLGQTPLFHSCTIARHNFKYWRNTKHFTKCVNHLKEVIQILLSHGANVNSLTHNKESILHTIANNDVQSCIVEVLELLISRGALVNAIDDVGLTPLYVAVKTVNPTAVFTFLKYDSTTKDFPNLLKMAIGNISDKTDIIIDNEKIVSLLLKYGADPNAIVKNDKTALQFAIEKRKIHITKNLLDCGADINKEDLLGNSCVTSLLTWNDEPFMFTTNENLSYARLFTCIFIHVKKLQALGCYVSEKVLNCCSLLYHRYQALKTNTRYRTFLLVDLDRIVIDCGIESKELKLIKIDKYTSLHSILLKNAHELTKHVKNINLFKIITSIDLSKRFPLYCSLLTETYKRGLRRSKVLQCTDANITLSSVAGLNLPDSCCDAILKHLTDEEVIILKKAVRNN